MVQSNHLLVGAVADDDTGMTDLCGMFAKNGVNAVMFFETQSLNIIEEYSRDAEVVVIGTRARNLRPNEAYDKTYRALESLKSLLPRTFYLKYCSTFDSTSRGNIGQMIDAGLDMFGGYTTAVPALPVNGRTTYMGNHFVMGVRLDRSPMKDHPLTPMTEADLVLWLGYQTKRKVGLADYNAVVRGTEALRGRLEQLAEAGKEVIVVDCITQRDLRTIDEACWNLRLITGSSGPAMELPSLWRRERLFHRRHQDLSHIKTKDGIKPLLVIAGSVSVATLDQNRFAIEHGFTGMGLDTNRLVSQGRKVNSEEVALTSRKIVKELSKGRNVIVYSALNEEDVRRTKDLGHSRGLTDGQIGDLISESNGQIASQVLNQIELNKLVVAGGETAGAVGRKLKLIGLHVGEEISPGVPICFAISKDPKCEGLVLALKSGNFGASTFYRDALVKMRRHVEGKDKRN